MVSQLTPLEVTRRTGVSGHTLRYYEKIGLLKGIGRLPNGRRFYSEHDIEWINILKLLRSTGMPIQKMLYLACLREQGDASITERIAYLTSYQQELHIQIVALEEAIKTIDKKIKRHQAILVANKTKE